MEATCANHPAAVAVAKCMHCQKALCDQCVHYHQSSVYCSPQCAKASEERGKELHRKLEASRSGGGLISGLIRFAIAAGIVLLILDFLDIDFPGVPNFF